MVSASLVRKTTALIAAAGLANAALPQVVRKGQYLFNSVTGERFYIKGVDYAANYGTSQQKPADQIVALDVLANVAGCTRDVPFLKQLGVNVVRVYQIAASADHSTCMKLLDDAGIYVLADLATPIDAISGHAPAWNLELMQHYLETVVEMGQYTNTLGFLIGNEVINGPPDTPAAAYLKGAVRDVKSWMNAHEYKNIVGYAATDKPESRVNLARYFACASDGVDEDTIADFYGINVYSWCSPSSYEQSGYADRTEELRDVGIVALLTENGCGTRGQRPFDDTPVILGPAMDYVWSGTFAFEFINEGNNFGIVELSADGSTITPSPDFAAYQSQLAAARPTPMHIDAYSPNVTLPLATCPTSDATDFPAATKLPPTPNSDLCACAVAASGCIASPTLPQNELGKAFELVCGADQEGCRQISGDGTFASGGVYGTYSMCAPSQQLSIVLGSYYAKQGRTAESCSFGGIAQVQTAASGTVAQCEASKSFPGGVGVPTPSAAIAGANPGAGTGGPSGSGNNSSTKPPKDGAASVVPSLVALGALVFGVVSLVA